ncbi:MAG: threonine/homoserine/homoserine lactone efflux protein [Paracoccaceae bacterium]|jgi:threonine/homoserine/homoserine lactone efflux protein
MIEVITGFEAVHLGAFILAGLLLNITPGADFIFISASGISGGPRIGMAAALGVNLGVWIHVIAAAAGVSAILLAYPAAYDAIRYAGAAYLLYLAWAAWRCDGILGTGAAAPSINAAIKRGFITNFLNPKTALFIFAFIPQFTDPVIGPIWMQILFLGAIFELFGFLFAMSLGAASGVFADMLRDRVGFLNKVTAVMFGGLATRLILD